MRIAIFAAIAAFALVPRAFAGELSCAPQGPTSRVLQSANPNDLHPAWTGMAYIGLSWSMLSAKPVENGGVEYLSGDLYSPQGSNQGQVFVIAAEWDCAAS